MPPGMMNGRLRRQLLCHGQMIGKLSTLPNTRMTQNDKVSPWGQTTVLWTLMLVDDTPQRVPVFNSNSDLQMRAHAYYSSPARW